MRPPAPIIAVDTREQKPYRFRHAQVKTLATGDYSIVGLEDEVAIERKSAPDLLGSLGKGRARFRRELERLAQLDYGAIVVESSLTRLLQPQPYSRMNPKSAVNSVLAWSVKYRVPVFFADDRAHGNALTNQLLHKYWRYHQGDPDAQER
jgi:DNA excision repair protein ERCC-4